MNALANYDPNLRWAKQHVRLTLKQRDYTATLDTTVHGNCRGFEIFESAIGNAFEELPTRTRSGVTLPYVVLAGEEGESLECEDDEDRREDWLGEMVVAIEIIEQVPA
jgi:hypothetical protein